MKHAILKSLAAASIPGPVAAECTILQLKPAWPRGAFVIGVGRSSRDLRLETVVRPGQAGVGATSSTS